jgi:CRP/FNR family transcriptional regulator, cyclic AMP receptor protein
VSVHPGAGQARLGEDTGLQVRRTFERSFRAGQVIYDEGEAGDVLYVIEAGHVELTRERPDGPRVVARLGAGDLFGELSALLGRPRGHRAVAVGATRLLELDAGTFEAMCVARPEIAIRVIQSLAERAVDLEQRLAALGVDDLLRPLVRVLLRRAEPVESGRRLATTLRALARESGLSLPEAHRALGQLLERRLVQLVDDVLQIPDAEALAACLDEGGPPLRR